MEWQPIKTAPRGLKVLVGYRNSHGHWRNITAMYYPKDTLPREDVNDDWEDEFAPAGWYETSETHEYIIQTEYPPTHWMPLPKPPSAA